MGVIVGVIGLGTAGSAVAWQCARRGLRVIGLERGPLAEAGARWVNGVPRWAFVDSGVEVPTGPELRAAEGPYQLVAGWGPTRVRARGALEVDMRHLVARLQAGAREAGADLREGVRVLGVQGKVAETSEGPVTADVWVEAAGLGGPGLLGQPERAREDLCSAAQEVRSIADPAGARAFLAEQGADEGEPVCFTSVAGGYSIVNVRVHGEEVGLLTGSVPALGAPGGPKLLADFVARHPWIGERRFGGARAIPLHRPWDVIGRGDRALVGDAAGLVFSAHGSGVAMQLVSARWLAEALVDGRGCWGWNVEVQRRLGGTLAGSDLFRRFSASSVDAEVLARLIRRGVLSPATMADTMEQRPSRPGKRAMGRALVGLGREPDLARRLVPVLVRMRAAERVWARYPEREEDLDAWRRLAERAAPRSLSRPG